MARKTKSAAGYLERILLQRLNSIDEESRAINARVDSLDSKIDSTKNETIDSLHSKLDSMKNELRAELTSIETKMDKRLTSKLEEHDARFDMVQQLAVIEAKRGRSVSDP